MTKTQPPAPLRFPALTGIRFVAAAMVFVYHNRKYWRAGLHDEVDRYFTEFHNGVSLFFVLSGFLIAYTYADKPLQQQGGYLRYMGLRAARILPLYWILLTCYYLDPAFAGKESKWLTYSLVHGFSDVHNLEGIAQAWSLNVEMVFYALAPLIYWLNRKSPWKALFFLLGLLALVTAVGYTWHARNGNPQQFFYPFKFLLQGSFFGQFPEFMAGLWLAVLIKKQGLNALPRYRYKTWAGGTAVLLCLYLLRLMQPGFFNHGFEHWSGRLIQQLVFPIAVVWLLLGLLQESTWLQRFLGSRVVVLLGNASFAFYLIHISYVNLKLKTCLLLPDRNFVLLWIIAIVLYLLVEKPIYNLCRRGLKKGK